MAGTTITKKTTVGLRLTTASQLPLTVTDTGAIEVASGDAVYIAAGLSTYVGSLGTIGTRGGIGVRALGAATIVNGGTASTKALIEGVGAGVDISGAATLSNFGTIAATASASTPGFASVGAYLGDGGTVTNGGTGDRKALITGGSVGVAAVGATATLTNFGLVEGTGTVGVGVWLADGGTVTNGGTADKTATISGAYRGLYAAAVASVTNFGTITGTKLQAVYLKEGGTVVNGAVNDTTASMAGNYNAIRATAATSVTNFGTLSNTNSAHSAVVLLAGGSLVNGSSSAKSATILGASGAIYATGGIASVTNFGTISGNNAAIDVVGVTGTVDNFGLMTAAEHSVVQLIDGGTVVNGSVTNTTALISDLNNNGVYSEAAVSVTNYGTISAPHDNGVLVLGGAGCTVVNGSSTDSKASITGTDNALFSDGTAKVLNYGTMNGSNYQAVQLALGGGSVTNFASGELLGAGGVLGQGAATTVTNLGNITGTKYNGVYLGAGGTVTNGSSTDTSATISGYEQAVWAHATSASITNFGTLSSTTTSFHAIALDAGGSVLNEATGQIVGASGIVAYDTAAIITNLGTITGTKDSGIYLGAGGTVTNGSTANATATISGPTGVVAGAAATIINFGTVSSTQNDAVWLKAGGTLTNGSTADTAATISGVDHAFYADGITTVTNFGTMSNSTTNDVAVNLQAGGTLVNGSNADITALISSKYRNAFYADGLAMVTNFGTISNSFNDVATRRSAVDLYAGGAVVNGSTADTAALIESDHNGIYATNSAISVTNYGTLSAPLASGACLTAGGTLVNGSASDTKALISGEFGVYIVGAVGSVTNYGTLAAGAYNGTDLLNGGTLTNDGTITSSGGNGLTLRDGPGVVINGEGALIAGDWLAVYAYSTSIGTVTNLGTMTSSVYSVVDLEAGGSVTNGSAADTTALMSGNHNGVYLDGPGTVTNYGTMIGRGYGGVFLHAGGTVTVANGSGADTSATMTGYYFGVAAQGGMGFITNLGTITGTNYSGIYLVGGGTVTNGGTGNATATISGPTGVFAGAADAVTITNFGTIASTLGTAGHAIALGNDADRLIVHPGAVFIGNVVGAGTNVLELAAGGTAGSLGGIGTQFTDFGSLVEDKGATWTLAGANNIGTLTDNGVLTVAGSLDVSASLDPAGTGMIDFGGTATLEVANVLGTGPAIQFLTSDDLIVDTAADFGLRIGQSTYTGPLLEKFIAGDTIDLKNVADSGLVLNYATATGLLTISKSGGGALASLLFQNSSLGAGGFHTGPDGGVGTLITHS